MSEELTVIISVLNNKGGVAKTTTVVNLGAGLALNKKRVLLVDLDSQSACTRHFGLDFRKSAQVRTIYDCLVGGAKIENVTLGTGVPLMHLVPSNLNLSGAEYELYGIKDKEHVLVRALRPVVKEYDFILIDCPPSLGTLSIAALTAADLLIIPVLGEFLSLSGLSSLLKFLKLAEKKLHKKVHYKILFTMFNRRLKLSKEVLEEVKKNFGDKLFLTKIPRNVTIAEAAGHGIPVAIYNKRCRGAEAYQSLAKEILEVTTK